MEQYGVDMHDFALAYALSTLSGLRVSYPVGALSLASHAHMVRLPQSFAWLSSDTALTIAVIACVVELIVHKFSWLETPIHYVHKILSPLVGGAAAFAVDPSHGFEGVAVALLGGGNAFAVHGLRTTARATGSAFFLGAVNPFASFVEDGLVLWAAGAAFFSARSTAWIVFAVTAGCWLLTYRPVPRHGRRRRARA